MLRGKGRQTVSGQVGCLVFAQVQMAYWDLGRWLGIQVVEFCEDSVQSCSDSVIFIFQVVCKLLQCGETIVFHGIESLST